MLRMAVLASVLMWRPAQACSVCFGDPNSPLVKGAAMGVLVLAGVIGFFLRRSGYSVAGIVLGLILGKIGEQTFAQAMQMLYFEWSGFFSRPIALGLLIAGLLTLIGSIYGAVFKKKPARAGST